MKKVFIVLLFLLFAQGAQTASATTFLTYPENPVLSGDGSGFDSVRIENPQVVLVDGIYHLYYGGTTGGNYIEIGSAISSDGANWTRVSNDPVLQCGEDTDSPCVTNGVWSSFRVVPEAVLHEDGVFKMWYLGNNQNRYAINKLGYATSTDGINWNLHAQNPVFQPYADTAGQFLGVVNVDGQYLLYYRHFDESTDTNLAISPDGVNWTPYAQNPIIENMSIDSVHQVGERVFVFADGVLGETVDGFEFVFEQSQAIGVDHPQVALSSNGSELFLWRNVGVAGLHFETAVMPSPLIMNEEVDPLVLQYAPKLALHPDEDYLPMKVVDFVEASALWDMDGADRQLHDAETLTYEKFEEVVGSESTQEYYLAFSDPDKKKSINLGAAKTKYDGLNSPTTVYYHKMNDGDYTVLQYWYFYAMNNWKEQGGFNNHEGDWESVFVYLDRDTQEPVHVAYSAHHNDGASNIAKGQYDSVRRGWNSNEVVKDGSIVTSYVALGSHANYPNNGDGSHYAGLGYDKTSTAGDDVRSADFLVGNAIAASTPFWMDYEGKWGADRQNVPGGDGPQGPAFSEVSGHVRFESPVAWAGIDKIDEKVADGTQKDFNFPKAGVFMRFAQAPNAGERMVVDPHDEWISFGEVRRGVTLLPKFWDITSSLENETFNVNVAFEYDPQMVADLGGSQHTLGVYYYDEVRQKWERQRGVVNTEAQTVTFETNHFSRYALGFVEEEVYLEDMFDELIARIEDSSLRTIMKRILVRKVQFAEHLVDKGRIGTLRAARQLLRTTSSTAQRHVRFGNVSQEESDAITMQVQQLLNELQK